jgi:hypothetical protein
MGMQPVPRLHVNAAVLVVLAGMCGVGWRPGGRVGAGEPFAVAAGPAAVTPSSSKTRTASTPTGRAASIWASAAASTTASAPRSPAWKRRSPLAEITRRLTNPRLVDDPPPYRPSVVPRGPIHLMVEYDAAAPAS